MKPIVGITQRVVENNSYPERRDALDQKWIPFLKAVGLDFIVFSNDQDIVQNLIKRVKFTGFLLSGGNNPLPYDGDAPERDEVENYLLDHSIENHTPVLGVCRGMQMMQIHQGGKLDETEGHIAKRHNLSFKNQDIVVNSYHALSISEMAQGFKSIAVHDDRVIEAMIHQYHPWTGIMWHPEREEVPQMHDLKLFKETFHS